MSTSPYFAKAFLGTNGRPAASGWLYAYAAGSTVPKAIFADISNTVPLANPLRLDGNGICPQFFTEAGLYDFKVFEYNFVTPDAPGPSCFTAEDIDGEVGGGGSTYILPIATDTVLGGVKPDGVTVQVDPDGVLSVGTGQPKTICVAIGGSDTARAVTLPSYTMAALASIDLPAGFFLVHSRLSLVVLINTVTDPAPSGYLQFIGYLGVPGGEASVFGTSSTGTNTVGTASIVCELFADSSTELVSSQVTATQDGQPANSNSSRDQPFDFSAPLRFSLRAMHLSASSLDVSVAPHEFSAYENADLIGGGGDPSLLFQPIENQRLSTSNAVAFAEVLTEKLRANSTVRSNSSVLPSTTIVTEHSGNGTDAESLPLATGSHDLRIYQNDGTKTWMLACSGADVARVPDPLATATSTLVYPGNTRWMYDSAPGVWKVISPGPFLPLFAGELNPVTGQCWFGSPTSSGGIVVRTDTSGTGTTNIDYYGGVDGKRRLTLRWSDVADAYTIQTSNDDGSARLDRVKVPRDSSRNLIFAGGVGHNVTTRTTTSATSTLAGITRYTGTGGHTETLPAATVVGEVREYRNSGTGPWTIQRAGSDQIDPGNPSALVTSITLLPGQSTRLYVATVALWESL